MKYVLVLLLLVSVVYPVYAVFELLAVSTHNQWQGRERKMALMDQSLESAYLGLTGAELAKLEKQDKVAADSYRRAVEDGVRLGGAYQRLWKVALGLDALLFTTSLSGLWLCRARRGPTTTAEDDASQTVIA